MVERQLDGARIPSITKRPAGQLSSRSSQRPRLQTGYTPTVRLVESFPSAPSSVYSRTSGTNMRPSKNRSTPPLSLPRKYHCVDTLNHPRGLIVATHGRYQSQPPVQPSCSSSGHTAAGSWRRHDPPTASSQRRPPSSKIPMPARGHTQQVLKVPPTGSSQAGPRNQIKDSRKAHHFSNVHGFEYGLVALQQTHDLPTQEQQTIEAEKVIDNDGSLDVGGAVSTDQAANDIAGSKLDLGYGVETADPAYAADSKCNRRSVRDHGLRSQNVRDISQKSYAFEDRHTKYRVVGGDDLRHTSQSCPPSSVETSAVDDQEPRHQEHFRQAVALESTRDGHVLAKKGRSINRSRHEPCLPNISTCIQQGRAGGTVDEREAEHVLSTRPTQSTRVDASPVYELDAADIRIQPVVACSDSDAFVGCVALQGRRRSPPVDLGTWDYLHGSTGEASERIDSPISPLSPGQEEIWKNSRHRSRPSLLKRSLAPDCDYSRSGKHFRDSGISAITQSRMVSGVEQRASLVRAPSMRIHSSRGVSQPLSPRASLAVTTQSGPDRPKMGIYARLVKCTHRLSRNKSSFRVLSPRPPAPTPVVSEQSAGCFPALCNESPNGLDQGDWQSMVRHGDQRAEMAPRHVGQEAFNRQKGMRAISMRPDRASEVIAEMHGRRAPPVVDALRRERLSRVCNAQGAHGGRTTAEDTANELEKRPSLREETPRPYVPPIFRSSISIAKGRSEALEGGASPAPLSRASSVGLHSQASTTPNFSRKLSQRECVSTRPPFLDTR